MIKEGKTLKRSRGAYDEAAEKKKDQEFAKEVLRKRAKILTDRTDEQLRQALLYHHPNNVKFCNYCQGNHPLEHWMLLKSRVDPLNDRCETEIVHRRKETLNAKTKPKLSVAPIKSAELPTSAKLARAPMSAEMLLVRKKKYPDGVKKCLPCGGNFYPFEHFYSNVSNPCGLGRCKIRTQADRKRTSKIVKIIEPQLATAINLRPNRISTMVGEEICVYCKEQKPLSQFHPYVTKHIAAAATELTLSALPATPLMDGEKKKRQVHKLYPCIECKEERQQEMRYRFDTMTTKLKLEGGGKCENCGHNNLDALKLVYRAGSPRKYHTNGTVVSPCDFWSWRHETFLGEVKWMKVLCNCCAQEERLLTMTALRTKPQNSSQVARKNFVSQCKLTLAKCADCDKKVEAHNLGSFEFDHLIQYFNRKPMEIAEIAEIETTNCNRDRNSNRRVSDQEQKGEGRGEEKKQRRFKARNTISALASSHVCTSLDKIKEEMDKCRLRCSNCRLISYKKLALLKTTLPPQIKVEKLVFNLVCAYSQ